MVLPQLWLWVIQLGYTDFVQDLQHAKARDQLASLTGKTIVDAASATHTFGAQGGCWWAAILACPPRAGSAHAATGSALAFGDLGKRQWLVQRWHSRHLRQLEHPPLANGPSLLPCSAPQRQLWQTSGQSPSMPTDR